MRVTGAVERDDESVEFTVVRCERDGVAKEVREPVQEEHILEIVVDGKDAMLTRCSAARLDELVVGRLITSGTVSSIEEIESIALSDEPLRAEVRLRRFETEPSSASAGPTSAYGDECLPAEGFVAGEAGLALLRPIPWSLDEVFREADVFAQDRTSHRKTRGTHSAYLFRRGELLLCREDIGRHNAFDKAVGAALLQGIALEECTLFTSGRVPTDMAIKAVRARIPIVVSKAVATTDTIKMAKDYALTLLCKATSRSVDVVNDSFGVVGCGEQA